MEGSSAAAAAAAAAADQQDPDAPWSLPADFLPVPAAFDKEQHVLALREYTHTDLVQLAQDFNQASQVHEDPFEAVLKGIPERAQLRPNHKEPPSIYMGVEGLPPHGKYARAWRKFMRNSKLDVEGGPPAKVRRPCTVAHSSAHTPAR